jgi:alpha-ribazole phosphatase
VTRVWMIRHGQPAEESRGRCYGALDVGLSEKGRAQIARVAEYLSDEPIDAIYCSPRSRAMESARILAGARSFEVCEDFREIDFGKFEGQTYDDIAATFPEVYRQWMTKPTEVKFPNGECFSEMRERVLRAFDAIEGRWKDRTVAIVSHGGVNRILIAWALQMPDECLFRIAQDYAAVNRMVMVGGVPSVELVNGIERG